MSATLIRHLTSPREPERIFMAWMLFAVGPDSSVGITTRYGLDGTRIESPSRRNFPYPSRPPLEPMEPTGEGTVETEVIKSRPMNCSQWQGPHVKQTGIASHLHSCCFWKRFRETDIQHYYIYYLCFPCKRLTLCNPWTNDKFWRKKWNFAVIGSINCGVHDGAVGWGTAFSSLKSRVRFPIGSLGPHYSPGVDSASNRNEYQ
jgi:hypothetical protein